MSLKATVDASNMTEKDGKIHIRDPKRETEQSSGTMTDEEGAGNVDGLPDVRCDTDDMLKTQSRYTDEADEQKPPVQKQDMAVQMSKRHMIEDLENLEFTNATMMGMVDAKDAKTVNSSQASLNREQQQELQSGDSIQSNDSKKVPSSPRAKKTSVIKKFSDLSRNGGQR